MSDKSTYFLKFDVNNLKINVQKKNWPQFVIFFIIIWTMAERFFIELGMPNSIIYLIDILNIFLFVATIRRQRWKKFYSFVLAYIGLLFFGVFVALVNYGIWGGTILFTVIEIRNVIRFPIFFLACITFLKEVDIEKIFRVLTIFFYVNFVMIIYQYITYHPPGIWTRGDYLNGLFGTSVGGNTFVNALMICIVVYWMCKWCAGECSVWKFVLPLGLSITVAALIELKAYFVQVVILYIWYLVSQKKTWKDLAKNILIIIVAFIVGSFALQLMYQEYPWFKETMSLKGIIELVSDTTGYTGNNDLNRLTAIYTISKEFFKGNILYILFGIGLGNGAVYSIGEIYTKFCQMYESSHYSWFSSAYIFVQCGLLGLVMYMLSFIVLFLKKMNEKYGLLTRTMILISFILMIYNETLKTDAGYLVYLAMASGFIRTTNEEVSKN